MSRPFKLEIAESEAELKKRLRHARETIHKEKLQMLWWVKSGQLTQQQEIAERLGQPRRTLKKPWCGPCPDRELASSGQSGALFVSG